jgi:hypothetical protein
MALSRQSVSIPFESVFVPLVETSGTLALQGGEAGPPVVLCILIPIFCNEDPEACADDCLDTYNDAVQAAQAAADLATENENTTHAANMQMLANNLNGALDLAKANYASQMQTCAQIGVAGAAISFFAGFLTLGAGFGGLIATATALATCQINAGNTRAQAINQAWNNYNTGVANENTRHAAALQVIANNLQAAIDAAQAALEDCLEDCYEICGWIVYCFYF